MTSHQGSTSTFYNCCQAILVVTLDDTEVKKTGPGLSSPILICMCMRAPHVVVLIHFTCIYDLRVKHNFKVFTAGATSSGSLMSPCPINPTVDVPVAAGTDEFRASQCPWKLGFHLPAFLTYHKAHRLISLFPQMLLLLACHQPLLRS